MYWVAVTASAALVSIAAALAYRRSGARGTAVAAGTCILLIEIPVLVGRWRRAGTPFRSDGPLWLDFAAVVVPVGVAATLVAFCAARGWRLLPQVLVGMGGGLAAFCLTVLTGYVLR